MTHFTHVSIRDFLEGKDKSREVRPDLELARENDVGIVRIEHGGMEVPAAVTIRTTITDQLFVEGGIRHTWHVTIAPDSSALRRRLFAEANPTHLGAHDAPVAGMRAASYDAVKAIERAHKGLSALDPPRVGTFVEMTYAISRRMEGFYSYRASTTEVLRRARGWARHQNKLAKERWTAAHWPANGPVCLFGFQVWPLSNVNLLDLIAEPEIPRSDPWDVGGDVYAQVGDVITGQFAEVLESLWKAAFKQDPFVAAQLTKAGYRLDTIEGTRLGTGPLGGLMSRFQNAGHMTMMAAPDIIWELGEENIRNLTLHGGNTNFSVEIHVVDEGED